MLESALRHNAYITARDWPFSILKSHLPELCGDVLSPKHADCPCTCGYRGMPTPEAGPELSQAWHIWRMKARPSMQKACTAASTLFRQTFSTRNPWLAGLRSLALTCKPPLPQAC